MQRNAQRYADGRAQDDSHPQRPHRQADEQPGGNSYSDADDVHCDAVGVRWPFERAQGPAFAGMTGSLLPLVPRGRLFLCRPAVVAGIAFVAERLPASVL